MNRKDFAQCWDMGLHEFPYRRAIYQMVVEKFSVRKALYPGCGLDISPSFFVPHVIYIDSAPLVAAFFQERERLQLEISKEKQYDEPCCAEFHHMDYRMPAQFPAVDLLLSQHAGAVSQVMKQFLKPGGLLLVAEGPDDVVELARNDPDFQFLGTVRWSPEQVEIIPEWLPPMFYRSAGLCIPIPIERKKKKKKL